MSGDYAKPVRRAVMPRLKSDGTLTSLVPAESIYPSTVPASRSFPFTRYGVPIVTPLRATGLDSSALRVTIHGFTKQLLDGDIEIATAEDMVCDIGSAIKDCLDGATLALEGGMKVNLVWLSTTPRQDPSEADAWATSVVFAAQVYG